MSGHTRFADLKHKPSAERLSAERARPARKWGAGSSSSVLSCGVPSGDDRAEVREHSRQINASRDPGTS